MLDALCASSASFRPVQAGGRLSVLRGPSNDFSSRRQVLCRADRRNLKVVFVSTEVAPWSKTGGLGDVASALPAALAARGHDVMTVAPRYVDYPGIFDTGLLAPVEVSTDLLPETTQAIASTPQAVPRQLHSAAARQPGSLQPVVPHDHVLVQGRGEAPHSEESVASTRGTAAALPSALVMPAGDFPGKCSPSPQRTGGAVDTTLASTIPHCAGPSLSVLSVEQHTLDASRLKPVVALGSSVSLEDPANIGGGYLVGARKRAVIPAATSGARECSTSPPDFGVKLDATAKEGPSVARAAAACTPAAAGDRPSGPTVVTYARLYACQERGVLRVFVDHPVFRSPQVHPQQRYQRQPRETSTATDPEATACVADVPAERFAPASHTGTDDSFGRRSIAAASNVAGGVPSAGEGRGGTGNPAEEPVQSGRVAPFPGSGIVAPRAGGGRGRPGGDGSRDSAVVEASVSAAAGTGPEMACVAPADPSVGVYTYTDGVSHVDLQARNSVLCQAALAAPVLLWQRLSDMPPELQSDLADAGGDEPCSLPWQALPFVLRNGLAQPALALEPGGLERLREALCARLNSRSRLTGPASGSGSGAGAASDGPPGIEPDCRGVGAFGRSPGTRAGKDAPRAPQHSEVVFVGNDWPSALLPLWLRTYREESSSSRQWTAGIEARLSRFHGSAAAATVTSKPVIPSSPAAAAVQPYASRLEPVSLPVSPSLSPSPSPRAAASRRGAEGWVPADGAGPTEGPHQRAPHAGASAVATLVLDLPPVPLLAPCEGLPDDTLPDDGGVLRWPGDGIANGPLPSGDEAHGGLPYRSDRIPSSGDGSGAPASSPSWRPAEEPSCSWHDAGSSAGSHSHSLHPGGQGSVLATADAADPTLGRTGARHADGSGAVGGPVSEVRGGAVGGPESPLAAGGLGALIQAEKAQQEGLLLQLTACLQDLTAGGEKGRPEAAEILAAAPSQETGGAGSICEPGAMTGPEAQPAPVPAPTSSADPQARMRATLRSFQRFVALRLRGAKVVTLVHNFAYQGLFPQETFERLGLPLFARQQMMLRAKGFEDSNGDGSGEGVQTGRESEPAHAEGPGLEAEGQTEALGVVTGGSGLAAPCPSPPSALPPLPSAPSSASSSGAGGGGNLSWLKAALLSADLLVTVSQGYARELTSGPGPAGAGQREPSSAAACQTAPSPSPEAASTSASASGKSVARGSAVAASTAAPAPAPATTAPGFAEGSYELCDIVATRGIAGIANGLDTAVWNPATDVLLSPAMRYDRATVAEGKARAKAQLQTRLGLEVDPGVPLFGFLGRLDPQKGADVVLAALPELMGRPPAGDVYNRLLGHDPGAARRALEQAQGRSWQKAQEEREAARDARRWRRLPAWLLQLLRWGFGKSGDPISPRVRPGGSMMQEAGEATEVSSPQPPSPRGPTVSGDVVSRVGASGPRPSVMQVAMLGSGQQWLEDSLVALTRAYPGRAAGVAAFDEPLSHLLMAGCDFLLVPSRWEPCGLVALAALRYGTVPIVAPTGGLPDALLEAEDCGGGQGVQAERDGCAAAQRAPVGVDLRCGLVMDAPMGQADDSMAKRRAVGSIVRAVRQACELYGDAEAYGSIRNRCMARDSSWTGPAAQWEQVLLGLTGPGTGGP